MPKLCQCRLEKLEKKYWEHVAECSLMDCVAEGNMILIQDCVCEKKEDRNLDCPNKCTVDEAVDRGCIYCANKAVYKSKQSQYPCEHTLSIVEIHDHTYKFTPRLWYCINPGCGLVTCLNPNDK